MCNLKISNICFKKDKVTHNINKWFYSNHKLIGYIISILQHNYNKVFHYFYESSYILPSQHLLVRTSHINFSISTSA